MTDELKQWEYDRGYEKGKADVLDKIRAEMADLEIIDYDYEGYYQEGYCKAITDVSQIIDKYRKEQE